MANTNKGNMWLVIVVVVALLAGGVYYFSTREVGPVTTENTEKTASTTESTNGAIAGMSVVPEGAYQVVPAESKFNWEAKKPLIEGYVDGGTISLKAGTISVGTSTASGVFTVDMTTLKVGLTAKAGKETALEAHLKSKDFFEVTKYPTTEFKITSVTPQADSATTFTYSVKGNLTMKGKTNEITFPAKIYFKDGMLHAEAVVEVDRTKWGITYGSGSFFDNLADNAISDMFSLSFHLVATQEVSGQPEAQ